MTPSTSATREQPATRPRHPRRLLTLGLTLGLTLLLGPGATHQATAQTGARPTTRTPSRTTRTAPVQPRPPAGALVVGGENQNERLRGRGRYVLVSGQGNHVLILGTAATLRVTGDNNEIRVHTVRQIEVTGRNNQIYYVRGPRAGRIYDRGGNEIRQNPGAV